MLVHVNIPARLRRRAGVGRLTVAATTAGEALEAAVRACPGLAGWLRPWLQWTPLPLRSLTLPPHLRVFAGDVEVRRLAGAFTPLAPGAELTLVPAIAGGGLLTDDQLERYSRHTLLPEVGLGGQRKLLDSKVLVVGAGGLGSPVAIYLAAAGVGTIGIVDGDRVDMSNLQRQILHFNQDVGRPKTQSARRHLEDLNPDVRVIPYQTVLSSENALEIIPGYDVVVNGCDNFPTRYLVNDACVMLKKPLVDASILQWEGQAAVFMPGQGCYRCLFPTPPPPGSVPSCSEAGVIGALAGHLGTLQVLETIKVLLGVGEPLSSRLILVDTLGGDYRVLKRRRNANCPVCGDQPSITKLIDYYEFCGVPRPDHAPAGVTLEPAAPVTATATGPTAGTAAAETAVRTNEAVSPGASGAGHASPAATATPATPTWQDPVDCQITAGAAAPFVGADVVQWVDVRELGEYQELRIPGITLIPMSEINRRYTEIDPQRPAVLVCHTGQRSSSVTQALRRAGYPRVYNLRGGMVAWMNQELPVETGD